MKAEARSALMSRIRGKNTKPEMAVRRKLHAMGYRYRLHVHSLPGTPDLVFPGRRKIIFVHGCFWHRHQGCQYAAVPKTRPEFWQEKFRQNVERDKKAIDELNAGDWDVLIVWECEVKNLELLQERLRKFLDK